MHARLWLPAGIAAMTAAAAVLLARKITRVTPTRRREELVAIDHKTVTLAATATTRLPGRYALIDPASAAHAQVGAIIDDDGTHVTRELHATTGNLTTGPVRWSGVYHASPNQLGAHRSITVPTPSGDLVAWIFNESGGEGSWAIHIHGQGATPHSALRGVPACARAGLTSLVAPYYGDSSVNGKTPNRTTFGVAEGCDVQRAIQLALDAGARDLVLIGWSLGANVALRLAATGDAPVRALVLVDPPLDWRGVLEHHRQRARFIPRALLNAATNILQTPILHRVGGSPVPIPFHRSFLEQPMGTDVPVLAITSAGDRDVPATQLERFAQLNPNVRIERFPKVPHTMEWNRDPDRWAAVVAAFCARPSKSQ